MVLLAVLHYPSRNDAPYEPSLAQSTGAPARRSGAQQRRAARARGHAEADAEPPRPGPARHPPRGRRLPAAGLQGQGRPRLSPPGDRVLGHGVRPAEPARAGRHRDRRRDRLLRQPHRPHGRAHRREGRRAEGGLRADRPERPAARRDRREPGRAPRRRRPCRDVDRRPPPVEELGRELQRRNSDTLLFVDCVTSLGAHDVQFDEWGFDYAYSCTQKALAAPPGMSPIAISDRALERVAARKHPVPFTFDLDLLAKYWIARPITYHHTAPILHIYALYEALRGALEEGLENRFARHAEAGAYLQGKIRERGLDLLADPQYQLAQLTAVRVPEGVDGQDVQARVLRDHDTETGGVLGPAAPPIWRLGLMGYNARREAADQVLAALDTVLADTKALAPTA